MVIASHSVFFHNTLKLSIISNLIWWSMLNIKSKLTFIWRSASYAILMFWIADFHNESVSTIFMPVLQETNDGSHAICGHSLWQWNCKYNMVIVFTGTITCKDFKRLNGHFYRATGKYSIAWPLTVEDVVDVVGWRSRVQILTSGPQHLALSWCFFLWQKNFTLCRQISSVYDVFRAHSSWDNPAMD